MDNSCVRDFMVCDVAVIRADRDVHELEKLLLRERIHGVPVVDADGRLVGVVSQTDLLAWHHATGIDGASFYQAPRSGEVARGAIGLGDFRTARIDELMSPVIHCICPDQGLALAAARMLTRRVHRLIVVDEEARVLGVISALDLLQVVPGVESAMMDAADEKRIVGEAAAPGG